MKGFSGSRCKGFAALSLNQGGVESNWHFPKMF